MAAPKGNTNAEKWVKELIGIYKSIPKPFIRNKWDLEIHISYQGYKKCQKYIFNDRFLGIPLVIHGK